MVLKEGDEGELINNSPIWVDPSQQSSFWIEIVFDLISFTDAHLLFPKKFPRDYGY